MFKELSIGINRLSTEDTIVYPYPITLIIFI